MERNFNKFYIHAVYTFFEIEEWEETFKPSSGVQSSMAVEGQLVASAPIPMFSSF